MVTLDEPLADALRRDWRSATLDPSDHAMLSYVEKLTRAQASVSRHDIESLHSAGFDDVAILQINLIASFFNYITRVADGLGVARS